MKLITYRTGSPPKTPQHQHGIALATALIFLVIITVLGLAAVRSSTTELRLANNEQVRVEALQRAQAVVDSVISVDSNFPINGNTSYKICYDSGASGNQVSCPAADASLVLPEQSGAPSATTPAGECDPNAGIFKTGVYAEARRLPPEDVPVPGNLFTSMDKFHTAAFAVRGQYACGNTGLGSADIEQGLLKLVPNANRIN